MAIKQVLFDLNGTLFDPATMAGPLEADRAEELVDEILGDTILFAMVETLSGSYRDFSELLRAAAERRLELSGKQDQVEAIVAAAQEMRPFPDASAAIETLRSAGIGAGVLTNSSTETARSLIAKAELSDLDPIVGTDEVRAFKPGRRVYERGVAASGFDADQVVLITAHSWDAIGAKRAGLRAGWIARRERLRFPLDPSPDFEAADLASAAAQIAAS
jgi:2-haloacid dehalogenase